MSKPPAPTPSLVATSPLYAELAATQFLATATPGP